MLWALVLYTLPFSALFSKILPCHYCRRWFKRVLDGYAFNTILRALL